MKRERGRAQSRVVSRTAKRSLSSPRAGDPGRAFITSVAQRSGWDDGHRARRRRAEQCRHAAEHGRLLRPQTPGRDDDERRRLVVRDRDDALGRIADLDDQFCSRRCAVFVRGPLEQVVTV